MPTSIENIAALHFSPYVLAPILEAFYEQAEAQPNNILLAYLVLPLVLQPSSKQFLKNSKSTSSLRTLCKRNENLYGLPARVQEFKELTNKCLQLVIAMDGACLKDDLSIHFREAKLNRSATPGDTIRAAGKLGRLIQPLDVVSIYRFLGVKEL